MIKRADEVFAGLAGADGELHGLLCVGTEDVDGVTISLAAYEELARAANIDELMVGGRIYIERSPSLIPGERMKVAA